MSGEPFPYGARLTRREYELAVVDLHGNAQKAKSAPERELIQRRELDLTIDYRLGTEFPKDRREKLWQAQQKIEKRRLKNLAARAAGAIAPGWLYRQTNWLARFVVGEYAKVLTASELGAFFGED